MSWTDYDMEPDDDRPEPCYICGEIVYDSEWPAHASMHELDAAGAPREGRTK